MSLKTSTIEGNIALVEPSGSLVGGEETVKLRQAISGFAERNYEKLLIDLGQVNYINSSGIGVLVAAHTSYSKKGWHIKLCAVNKSIDSILVITKLTLIFDVYDTRNEAIKSFI